MATPGTPAAFAPSADGAALLAGSRIRSCLGHGSNASVLCVQFGAEQPGFPSVPRERKCAVKLSSHFWDMHAKLLLDCERDSLERLPPHPNIIRSFAQFNSAIPDHMREHTMLDMQTAAANDPDHATQVFIFEYHPLTLDTFRYCWPWPIAWPVVWRIARDLVAATVHMEASRIVHLDFKLDNILVAYDGRCVLTDFGISRVFDDGALRLAYREPFDLLMNRLVLAPEVLRAHDASKARWRAARRSARKLVGGERSSRRLSSTAAAAAAAAAPAATPSFASAASSIASTGTSSVATAAASNNSSTMSSLASTSASEAAAAAATTSNHVHTAGRSSATSKSNGVSSSVNGGNGSMNDAVRAVAPAGSIASPSSTLNANPAAIAPLTSTSAHSDMIPFGRQGIWSVGAALYEICSGFSPEPTYPVDGGGVRNLNYSLAGIPPLRMRAHVTRTPSATSTLNAHVTKTPATSASRTTAASTTTAAAAVTNSEVEGGRPQATIPTPVLTNPTVPLPGFVRADNGSFRIIDPRGYPSLFCALVMGMLEPDPEQRVSAIEALAVLDAMKPLYVSTSTSDVGASTSTSDVNSASKTAAATAPNIATSTSDMANTVSAATTAVSPVVAATEGAAAAVFPVALPLGGTTTMSVDDGVIYPGDEGPYLAESDETDDGSYLPVLLRTCDPERDGCRLLRCHTSLSVGQIVDCWALGAVIHVVEGRISYSSKAAPRVVVGGNGQRGSSVGSSVSRDGIGLHTSGAASALSSHASTSVVEVAAPAAASSEVEVGAPAASTAHSQQQPTTNKPPSTSNSLTGTTHTLDDSGGGSRRDAETGGASAMPSGPKLKLGGEGPISFDLPEVILAGSSYVVVGDASSTSTSNGSSHLSADAPDSDFSAATTTAAAAAAAGVEGSPTLETARFVSAEASSSSSSAAAAATASTSSSFSPIVTLSSSSEEQDVAAALEAAATSSSTAFGDAQVSIDTLRACRVFLGGCALNREANLEAVARYLLPFPEDADAPDSAAHDAAESEVEDLAAVRAGGRTAEQGAHSHPQQHVPSIAEQPSAEDVKQQNHVGGGVSSRVRRNRVRTAIVLDLLPNDAALARRNAEAALQLSVAICEVADSRVKLNGWDNFTFVSDTAVLPRRQQVEVESDSGAAALLPPRAAPQQQQQRARSKPDAAAAHVLQLQREGAASYHLPPDQLQLVVSRLEAYLPPWMSTQRESASQVEVCQRSQEGESHAAAVLGHDGAAATLTLAAAVSRLVNQLPPSPDQLQVEVVRVAVDRERSSPSQKRAAAAAAQFESPCCSGRSPESDEFLSAREVEVGHASTSSPLLLQTARASPNDDETARAPADCCNDEKALSASASSLTLTAETAVSSTSMTQQTTAYGSTVPATTIAAAAAEDPPVAAESRPPIDADAAVVQQQQQRLWDCLYDGTASTEGEQAASLACTLAAAAAAAEAPTMAPSNFNLYDMREAVLHRSLLSLTALTNIGLREPSPASFPFLRAAELGVLTASMYPHTHDTVASVTGLFRNLSCTDDPVVARSLVEVGVIATSLDVFFGPWKRLLSQGGTVSSAETGTEQQPNLDRGMPCHGADPRIAEDALLAASNLLRFDELQTPGSAPLRRCAQASVWALLQHGGIAVGVTPPLRALRERVEAAMGNGGGGGDVVGGGVLGARVNNNQQQQAKRGAAIDPTASSSSKAAHGNSGKRGGGAVAAVGTDGMATTTPSPVVDSAVRLLRYASGVEGEAAARALAEEHAMHALVGVISSFPAERAPLEMALHVICSLLVHESCRTAELCPFVAAAKAVVAVMKRPEYADDVSIQGLGATVLRNLACVALPVVVEEEEEGSGEEGSGETSDVSTPASAVVSSSASAAASAEAPPASNCAVAQSLVAPSASAIAASSSTSSASASTQDPATATTAAVAAAPEGSLHLADASGPERAAIDAQLQLAISLSSVDAVAREASAAEATLTAEVEVDASQCTDEEDEGTGYELLSRFSPALAVTHAGAPAVLEAAMERHPTSTAIQENGRCALYNLLLIGAADAKTVVLRARRLSIENAGLRRVMGSVHSQLTSVRASAHLQAVAGVAAVSAGGVTPQQQQQQQSHLSIGAAASSTLRTASPSTNDAGVSAGSSSSRDRGDASLDPHAFSQVEKHVGKKVSLQTVPIAHSATPASATLIAGSGSVTGAITPRATTAITATAAAAAAAASAVDTSSAAHAHSGAPPAATGNDMINAITASHADGIRSTTSTDGIRTTSNTSSNNAAGSNNATADSDAERAAFAPLPARSSNFNLGLEGKGTPGGGQSIALLSPIVEVALKTSSTAHVAHRNGSELQLDTSVGICELQLGRRRVGDERWDDASVASSSQVKGECDASSAASSPASPASDAAPGSSLNFNFNLDGAESLPPHARLLSSSSSSRIDADADAMLHANHATPDIVKTATAATAAIDLDETIKLQLDSMGDLDVHLADLAQVEVGAVAPDHSAVQVEVDDGAGMAMLPKPPLQVEVGGEESGGANETTTTTSTTQGSGDHQLQLTTRVSTAQHGRRVSEALKRRNVCLYRISAALLVLLLAAVAAAITGFVTRH